MAIKDPLSIQLYSLRNFPPLADQLALVKRVGFTNVEPFGGLYGDLDALESGLKENGLTAKSGHFSLQAVEDEAEQTITTAKRLGMTTVVMPYLQMNERPTDRGGWTALGGRLATAAERLSGSGLRFAYHNHDFEFRPLPDGTMPMELLLSELVFWEADLAWVAKAGVDPLPWLDRYKGRVPLVHIKDIAPAGEKADEDGWADVGTGTLDWSALWHAAADAGAETMVAEHDKPSDGERFARVSAENMARFMDGRA